MLVNIIKIILIIIAVLLSAVVSGVFWATRSAYPWNYCFLMNYRPLKKKAFKPEKLTVVTYNIGYGSGLDNNQGNVISKGEIYSNLDRIIACIRKHDADIVALQEADINSRRTHYINQVEYIAKKAGFRYAAYAITWDKKYVPYPVSLSFKKHFGYMQSCQAVLSRYPIKENRYYSFIKPLNKPFWWNMFYSDRGVQCLEIKIGSSDIISFYNVHLEAYDKNTRGIQVGQLLKVKDSDGFRTGFIAGDFNSLPPRASKRNDFIDEPEDDYRNDNTINIMIEKSKLREIVPDDAYIKEENTTFSFPSDKPARRLDYIFFTGDLILIKGFIDRYAGTGSDHLPAAGMFRYK